MIIKQIQKFTNKKKNMNTNEAKYNVIVKDVTNDLNKFYSQEFADSKRNEIKGSFIKSILASLKSETVSKEKMIFVKKIKDEDIAKIKEDLLLIKRYHQKPKWSQESRTILIGEIEERIILKLKELKLFMDRYR